MGKVLDRIRDVLGEDIPNEEGQEFTAYDMSAEDKKILEAAMAESARLEKEVVYNHIKRSTKKIQPVSSSRTVPQRTERRVKSKDTDLERG